VTAQVVFGAAAGPDELLGPEPRWLARPRLAVWTAGRDLIGWVLWSHIGDDDAEEGKQLWLTLARRMARPYDFVLDLRGLASISAGAYERIREFAHAIKPGLRRHAILVGEEHAGGTIQLGLYVMKPPDYQWRSFLDYRSAAEWLDRPGAREVLAAVDLETGERRELAQPLGSLRAMLSRDPRVSVEEAARRLGCSPRSLQRTLRSLGTTFSDEVDRARVVRAQDRLGDPDSKLDAVALDVGCADRKSLNRLFRRVCGESAADFRKRIAGR
jgi:AraC-like DNA-binding protein